MKPILAALLLVLPLAACESAYDDPCYACRDWEFCRADECVLRADSRWDVIALGGEVAATPPSGLSWDPNGGAPDPMVCLTVASVETCTTAATDNLNPMWNEVVAADVDVGPLLEGIRMRYADQDEQGLSDTICSGKVPVSLEAFQGQGFTLTCQAGAGRVAFELRHRP